MTIRKILQLDEDSRSQLQRIVKRSGDWRERERAQTLLLLDSGLFAQAVADQPAAAETLANDHLALKLQQLCRLKTTPDLSLSRY